jgi:UDP-N-acetylmuramate dehydrogenase
VSDDDDPLLDELRHTCGGEVRGDATLGELTTLRVGGPVRVMVTAESDEDLAAVGRGVGSYDVPWLVVGRGSNLLVSDDGWPGVVVTLGRGFRGVRFDAERVRAGAAEPLPALAKRIADKGLGGFAWAAAVPGSLGGAVRMNAGAHGGEMSQALVEVDLFRLRHGVRETWPVAQLGLSYRRSELPDDAVVVSATLQLHTASSDEIRDEIAEIRQWRRDHQPLNEPNCGSVFTNPQGDSAGRLVETAGAKGLSIGGATVSTMHANFIVTAPGATATDVVRLIDEVRRRVAAVHGVDLVPEVQMRGFTRGAG